MRQSNEKNLFYPYSLYCYQPLPLWLKQHMREYSELVKFAVVTYLIRQQ